MGRRNRENYIKQYELLDEDYIPTQVYVQSTEVTRVIYSSYIEMLGLFPPGSAKRTLPDKQVANLKQGKGLPPINVRMERQINENLGSESVVSGLVQIPVFNYGDLNFEDDINPTCKYVIEGYGVNALDPNLWKALNNHVRPILKIPFTEAFNITDDEFDNLNFKELNDYAEVIYSEGFEGVLHLRYNFTEYEFKTSNSI